VQSRLLRAGRELTSTATKLRSVSSWANKMHPFSASMGDGQRNCERFTAGLSQGAELAYRPIPKNRFAVDKALVHRPEIAAVVGEVAMIA